LIWDRRSNNGGDILVSIREGTNIRQAEIPIYVKSVSLAFSALKRGLFLKSTLLVLTNEDKKHNIDWESRATVIEISVVVGRRYVEDLDSISRCFLTLFEQSIEFLSSSIRRSYVRTYCACARVA